MDGCQTMMNTIKTDVIWRGLKSNQLYYDVTECDVLMIISSPVSAAPKVWKQFDSQSSRAD